MSTTAIAWLLFGTAAAITAWLLVARVRAYQLSPDRSAPSALPPQVTARERLGDLGSGWLRVASSNELIEVCALRATLQRLQRECKLAPHVWQRDIEPAIHAYLDMVQLLPASESHHHANAGGLAVHGVETALGAVSARNGHLLPPGGKAEQIDAQRDHWTYGVVFGALLHDLGKVMTDLRIEALERIGATPGRWYPLAGSLPATGAVAYRVGFAPKSERDYSAHRKLPVIVLQRIVPATALAFLGRQPRVLEELTQLLGGEECATSVLARIVRQADQHSAATNLQTGTRARFPAASAVPLIERMQSALRSMLAEGELPLNRDGAAGWVGDGAVFLVAKRCADAVREKILSAKSADEAGVPSKNDRLFDSWQDYRVIDLNPETGQAIWYMTVTGPDYCHEFAMLRFPLKTLFDDPAHYPSPFDGTLAVRAAHQTPDEATNSSPENESRERPATAKREGRANPVREPKPAAAPVKKSSTAKAAPQAQAAQSAQPREAPTAAAVPAVSPKRAKANAPEEASREPAAPKKGDFLDEDDCATRSAEADATLAGERAVTPFVADPVGEHGEPHPMAVAFVEWLQRGLASGSMRYNESGAMVHFVEQGMALVSPRIFKAFADEAGEDDGETRTRAAKPGGIVQRHVIKAGWHVVTAGANNIQHYAVIKRNGELAGKLAAVVLKQPERWVNPVPARNPNLRPFEFEEPAKTGS